MGKIGTHLARPDRPWGGPHNLYQHSQDVEHEPAANCKLPLSEKPCFPPLLALTASIFLPGSSPPGGGREKARNPPSCHRIRRMTFRPSSPPFLPHERHDKSLCLHVFLLIMEILRSREFKGPYQPCVQVIPKEVWGITGKDKRTADGCQTTMHDAKVDSTLPWHRQPLLRFCCLWNFPVSPENCAAQQHAKSSMKRTQHRARASSAKALRLLKISSPPQEALRLLPRIWRRALITH